MRRIAVVKEMVTGLDFAKNLTLKELGISAQEGNIYSASPEVDLHKTLESLEINPTHAILDFGSGKGAAVAIMSKFPFNFVDGVEVSQQLCDIAERNLEKLGLKNVSIFCADARAFDRLDRYTHFYFFNPFPDVVLRKVMENIVASHAKAPRKITLIYYLPAYRAVIDECPLFNESKKIQSRYYETVVYQSR